MRTSLNIERKIEKHCENSKKLKQLYIGCDQLSYDKTMEIKKQQDEEYKKMLFYKNLKKEIEKSERN